MNRLVLLLLVAVAILASGPMRAADESAGASVEQVQRMLGIDPDSDDDHIMAATWNGYPFLFVDYLHGDEREVVALERVRDGYRRVDVTVGEEEGGVPDVAAFGFANADRDSAKELIVLLSWHTQHYDVEGTYYEVRIFDDLHPGQSKLTYLSALSRHFEGHNCDCEWRSGKSDHYPFRSIASIKKELKKMGF